MILKKIYTREFPVLLCNIWINAYKIFLGRKIQTYPRYVLILKDGLTETYRPNELSKELNKFMLEELKKDNSYVEKFYEKYMKVFDILKNLWEKETLSKDELIVFVEQMSDFWQAIYYSMYLPLDEKFAKKDRDLMVKMRSEIDIAADEATHVILRSLKNLYPENIDLINYITLNDLKCDLNLEKIMDLKNNTRVLLENEFISLEEFEILKKKYGFELEKIVADKKLEDIKGQIACKGYAKGKVKKVMRREDISKLEQGNILVSSMTVPDFLPAMKKAAAFITDEGGITCHAAIVAREMNKPCVIGTKIATKIFEDGDLVEVDANKGIVRKLK